MPRGGARPGAGRKPKAPGAAAKKAAPKKAAGYSPDGKKSADAPASWPFGTAEQPQQPAEDLSELTPLAYLLTVVRNPLAEEKTRIQAASIAAPYCHAKKGEAGKKEAAAEVARKGSPRFAQAAPPRLAAAGGKKV
ncbi:MAG: hypothetical protein ACT6S0_04840 [Roseateles sp.]|uniref:hypothetical protein n=1 Tax=Roseateles sp. TaxID=1971397 RepID=UPI00403728AE